MKAKREIKRRFMGYVPAGTPKFTSSVTYKYDCGHKYNIYLKTQTIAEKNELLAMLREVFKSHGEMQKMLGMGEYELTLVRVIAKEEEPAL